MGDLGDLSNFIKEGSVAKLDWLDVNEEDYRKLDQLPKQNLDISPDLQALWAHEDRPASAYLVPNKDRPQTMGDMSEAHGKLASEVVSQVEKVTRLALMQSPDLAKLKQALVSRFDSGTIQAAKPVIAGILQERGLLGPYYIAADDFQACHKASKETTTFARRFASTAKFVVAKSRCSGCIHNAGNNCAVFQKEIVLEVPFTPELANAVERAQAAKGKLIQASSLVPRERIRAAHLATDVALPKPAETPKPIVNPAQFMKATEATARVHLPVLSAQAQKLIEAELAWNPNASTGRIASAKTAHEKKAFEVTRLLRREMLKGRSEPELLQALKLSFSIDDLKSTRTVWEPYFKQAGLFGTVYTTQESFDDCHTGADFLAKHNPSIKGIVASGKCGGCIYNKIGRCMMYGRPLVAKAEDLYTPEVVSNVVREHRLSGRLASGAENVTWGPTPREALKAVYRTASQSSAPAPTPGRAYVEQEFRGASHGHITAGLTKREVVKTAARYLNEGLYGEMLLTALLRRFDPRDVSASTEDLRPVLAEQGLQGIHFIDPTVYEDYAKGCDEGARLHRARLVPYVKLASKCSTCVHQTKVGYCSKYNKALVVEPPYADKAAQQREMLASGKANEVSFVEIVNAHASSSMLKEFGMRGKEAGTIELNPEVKQQTFTVELGGARFEL